MSLPFRIGDVVEIDEEKTVTDSALEPFTGRRAIVKTMGISWVKVEFEGGPTACIISSDSLKKVEEFADKVFMDEII
jgi:hypothetical protein